jgi:hypothetical protein
LSRAATQELRKFLQDECKAAQKKNKEVKNRLESNKLSEAEEFIKKYFSSWIPSSVHIATSSKKYQTVETIAQRLGLSEELVLGHLKFLEKHRLVKRESGTAWVFAGGPMHLSKEISVNNTYQLNRRLQVIKSIQQNSNNEDMHFSSIFTLDKKSLEQVRTILLESIEKSHKVIHAGGTDEMYGITIDLFEVV